MPYLSADVKMCWEREGFSLLHRLKLTLKLTDADDSMLGTFLSMNNPGDKRTKMEDGGCRLETALQVDS